MAQVDDPVVIQRIDPGSFADLGDVDLGSTGGFPPDAQTLVMGSDGVWVPLAAQRAVALIDPASGVVTRRMEVDAAAYSLIEREGELWIVDLESDEVVRLDLRTERELARMSVEHPVGIAYADGAMWVIRNAGRHEPNESLSGPGGSVARINTETNVVDNSVAIGHRPLFVTSGFGSVWASNATSGSVSRVDPATNIVTDIPIGADGAFDIEATSRGVFVVIGEQWGPPCNPETSYFVRIDPESNRADARIDFPCPTSITPESSGYGLWVTGQDDEGVVSALVRGLDQPTPSP